MEGLESGVFVGGTRILSGTVTVTGITVPSRGVGIVQRAGLIVWVGATYLTAEAAAATLLARLSWVGFLAMSRPPDLGVAAVTVMFVSRGMIGNKGERLGLYMSASLHCFLMYLQ